jgi:RNA polymerase sigma-70 factor (ECF subfamily)
MTTLKALSSWRVFLVSVKSDDTILISEALEGSEQAYSLLTSKYWDRIYRFLRKRVNDNALAEELTQDTFVAAFKYLRTFRGDSQFYTWLCTIAINKASKRPLNSLKTEVENITVDTPESIYETRQTVQHIMSIIDTLPSKQKKALLLKLEDNMCYNDIAVILRCSPNHAKNLVWKAKKTIRSYYDERRELSDDGGAAALSASQSV